MTIQQILFSPIRLVLTAYCFLQFSVQVLWLSKQQMPKIIRHGEGRRGALYLAHRHVIRYLATLDILGLVKFNLQGEPHASPCILVGNHPCLLDFIVLLKDLPNAVCLYKTQSLDNPVLSSFVQIGGYIEGMDGTQSAHKRIVESCCERLSEQHHVVFFPEGTRSESATTVRKFRSIAFHAAVKCSVPVQPVVILCEPLFLGKGQSWFEFSSRKNTMTVVYLPAIHLSDLPVDERTSAGFSRAVRAAILETLTSMSGTDYDA
ncbi:MAG TPA: 1-acyl-sn-glycerol-3-phosphate acyltransferase [Flavobacteriales bacterium]|jgi:1-acyl-sn-glycerol-3-phosphate acyltransferase|nr:1-acyl-sn-glycerol-3-phosphate acyltransferase [Flavobacteriales bacterium]